MRPVWLKQKYLLIRLLGKEIWGNLLRKRSVPYLKYNRLSDLGRVCNFVILEHERRVLFDFRKRFTSFKTARFRDRDYFAPKRRLERRWIARRIIKKKFTWYDFRFYKRKQMYLPIYNRVNNKLLRRRSARFLNFWVGYIALIRLFMTLRRRKLKWLIRVVRRFGPSYKRRRLPLMILRMVRKRIKRRIKLRTLMRKKLRAPSVKRNHPVLARKLVSLVRRSKSVIRGVLWLVIRRNQPRKRSRVTTLEASPGKNRGILSFHYWLTSFLFTFPTMILKNPAAVLNSRTPKPGLLDKFFQGRNSFSTKFNVLLKLKWPLGTSINYEDRTKLFLVISNLAQWFQAYNFISCILWWKSVREYGLSFGSFIGEINKHNFLLTLKWPIFGCHLTSYRRYSILNVRTLKRFKKRIRVVYRRAKIGWLAYKLRDRRDLLLQLKYTVIRLRLGDYEEGFRIPYAPNLMHTRAKTHFKRLELYRWRSFYGIFNVRQFKAYYYIIMKRYKSKAQHALLTLLECRPIFLLHLTNLFPSIYFIDQFIQHRNLLVNQKICVDPNRPLGLCDMVTIPVSFYWKCLNTLVYRLMHLKILVNMPNYLEFNYIVLTLAVISIPKKNQLSKPFLTKLSTYDYSALVRAL